MKQSIKILVLMLILQQIICSSSALNINEFDSNDNESESDSNDNESDSNDNSSETSFNDLLFNLKKLCNLTDDDFNDNSVHVTYFFGADIPSINYGKINANETDAGQLCFVNDHLTTASWLQRTKRSTKKGREINIAVKIDQIKLICKKNGGCNFGISK